MLLLKLEVVTVGLFVAVNIGVQKHMRCFAKATKPISNQVSICSFCLKPYDRQSRSQQLVLARISSLAFVRCMSDCKQMQLLSPKVSKGTVSCTDRIKTA